MPAPARAATDTAITPVPSDSDSDEDDLDRLGDAIAELAARIQAATHELLVLIREFDDRQGGSTASAPAPTVSTGARGSSWAAPARRSASPTRSPVCRN